MYTIEQMKADAACLKRFISMVPATGVIDRIAMEALYRELTHDIIRLGSTGKLGTETNGPSERA